MIKNRAMGALAALAAAALVVALGACSPSGSATKYNITIGSLSGGSITSDAAAATEGATVTLTVAPSAGMKLTSGSLKVTSATESITVSGSGPYAFTMPAADVAVTGSFSSATAPLVSLVMPLDFENGSVDYASSQPGYGNTMSSTSFGVAIDKTQTDTGYKLVTLGTDDTSNTVSAWNATGLTLGANVLSFQYGSNADSGHIILSLKNLDFGSFAGKTGLQFEIKLPGIHAYNPTSGAIGLMPHLRYNKGGTDENNVVFAREWWAYQLMDDAYFRVQIPFSVMTKPGYADASDTYTAVADAIAGGVVFNQLDFDMRFVNGSTGVDDGTIYTGYIDNIQLY